MQIGKKFHGSTILLPHDGVICFLEQICSDQGKPAVKGKKRLQDQIDISKTSRKYTMAEEKGFNKPYT
jgi:hypothetical protein